MKRDLLSGVFLSFLVVGMCWVASGLPGCRTALQVSTRIYECHQEVKEGGSITLRDCKVTDDDQAEAAPGSDQTGDDTVDVKADPADGATFRAVFSPPALAVVKRSSQASAAELADQAEAAALADARRRHLKPRKRKRKATGRVRVAGYTRRRPVRRRRKK